MTERRYKGWGSCSQCDYQGEVEYQSIEGESYDSPEHQMVMLEQSCPACDAVDNSLLPYEYFKQIQHGEEET